jgi:hypothetical protein
MLASRREETRLVEEPEDKQQLLFGHKEHVVQIMQLKHVRNVEKRKK